MARNLGPGIVFGIAGLLAGCQPNASTTDPPPLRTAKSSEAESPEAKGSAASSAASGGTVERNFNGARFQVPSEWAEKPNHSGMIDAEFVVPGPKGDGRLTLSTAGGGAQANIERWKGQFQHTDRDPSPKESQLAVAGKDATLVELYGTFHDGLGGEAKSNWAMLGVVIPLKSADRERNYFIKFTGPLETVTEARETFMEFVESGRFNE